ncbi:hypothetical protein ZIOFF_070341 [Zingiber officinale]|uniref:SWIB domain-containing protein n=1 Tax=Zingiber officinale TaxID=94328 RepID=A0A8J5C7P3_ZINOF|nr:hypothetical protein ZIOFF_070341 [Zingiber officinale]
MVAASIPRERKAAAEAMSRVLGSGRVLMAAAKGGAKEAAAARVVTKVAAAAPPAAAAATPPKVGLRKPVPVSPALRKFLGVQESTRMEVVKKIWEHIKANQLQLLVFISPFLSFLAIRLICSSPFTSMRPFGLLCTPSLCPHLCPLHLHSFSRGAEAIEGLMEEGKRKRRQLRVYLLLSYIPLAIQLKLIAISIINQLAENPKNKQEIRCDEKLKTIFDGKDKVGMLEMGKLLNPHFLKP